ncbi:MAG: diaminopimelate epimerase [Proteobacteria bacterium]|nr:diaminopimelate epimerase [Pseudomonadota bacterium]
MKHQLKFHKMQGLGNDYIYVNCLEQPLNDAANLAKKLSDRRFGIGSDGLILICPSNNSDFKMIMHNPDGSEGTCGNGLRCVAKYVYDLGFTKQKNLSIETNAGQKMVELIVDKKDNKVVSVCVDMGEPILDSSLVPVISANKNVIDEDFQIGNLKLKLNCVSMGNPHAIFFVDKINDHLVLEIGPIIETHEKFPKRTNVEFVEVINRQELNIRVWERGTGETLACGTGACATAVAAALNQLTERKVTLHFRGGDILINWAENNHVYQTGPAEFVFEGMISY